MRVVVIAPHPDDETIGVGGTICRHVAEGDEVHLLVMTETYPPLWHETERERRQEEVRRAAEVLGLASVDFAGFPTVKLNAIPAVDLAGYLIAQFNRLRPDIVYVSPPGDVNQDHEAVFRAALVAARPLPDSSVKVLYSYEVAPTSRFGNPIDAARWMPTTFVDITPYIDRKLEAMSCYASELRQPPHPRSLEGLRLFARERGLAVGLEYAEAFQLIREIR